MLVGEKNPNKQNTKYIYLETVKKASFFFHSFICEQTYDLPRWGGGVSPSFLLILVKMDGGCPTLGFSAPSTVSLPR